jgi:hypothetical protein
MDSWDGYVKRGRVNIRTGGSGWSIDGEPVSHTEEYYASGEVARYVLSRLKGTMHPGSELTASAAGLQLKVTSRRRGTRIAWVCGTTLHYVETKKYSTAIVFLPQWKLQGCD